jgi:hypothetical protein
MALAKTIAQPNPPDALIACVRDVKSSRKIEADAVWPVELRAFSRTTIARETSLACTCNDSDAVVCKVHAFHLVGP